MQEGFEYSEATIKRLTRAISADRLKPYLIRARGDYETDLRLYARNTDLSEALYGVVQGMEVLLRTATHSTLVRIYASESWFDVATLRDSERNDIEDAKKCLQISEIALIKEIQDGKE